MKYIELTVNTTPEAEELIADKMWEYTGYGVSMLSDTDLLELINKRRSSWDYIEDELLSECGCGVTHVKCYFDVETADEKRAALESDLRAMKENSKNYIDFGTLETSLREVDGDDWIEVWRRHYRPIPVGNVVICPEWIDYEPQAGQITVKLDSNLAFGTGEHETTSMCIEFLQKYVKNGCVTIDVGTGSGILGITAVKLGAQKAVMTDIDPIAVSTAKHNAELNGVADKCLITLDNLLDESESRGDIVVANITADVLLILTRDILNHCNEGAIAILSGILRERAEEVVNAYSSLGFKVVNSESKGEWVAFALKKI